MGDCKKVIFFMLIYFMILQLTLGSCIAESVIYNHRMNYDLIKDRPSNIEVVLEHLSKEIKNKEIKDYIVILGNSVAFGSPGPANKSIGYYMERKLNESGKKIKVFNLALPSNQIGDVYTIMLKMDEYGISREHIIINLIYAGFVARNPSPPPVFWFGEQLRKIDKKTFEHVKNSLLINKKAEDDVLSNFHRVKRNFMDYFSVTKYKDFIELETLIKLGKYKIDWLDENGTPWYEKENLVNLLKEPLYQSAFSNEKFIMNESNEEIYFLKKIIELQENKNTLYFLAGINQELMKDETSKKGYIENVNLIDDYFKDKDIEYINLTGMIDYKLFSDHIHLIPKGYEKMTEILLEEIKGWLILGGGI